MLVVGETYNQRKASILENIKVCRELIREVNKLAKKNDSNRDMALEVIEVQNSVIKEYVKELVDLERWRKATGLDKNARWGNIDDQQQ